MWSYLKGSHILTFFPLRIEQNPSNPFQQDSPFPCMPCKQTPRKPTPGLSGNQWSEDLFCSKQPPFPFLILAFASSELTFPPFVEPSQYDEPPIPGLSQPSEPHEDTLTCEPEPEVAPKQSKEEPFGKSPLHFFHSFQLFLTPPLAIFSLSHYNGLCNNHQQYAHQISPSTPTPEIPPISPKNPTASSPQSQDEALPGFTYL
ncbi:hypothetical protein O181_066805 [Austropuccinia psidii MF-1]|uniref:Uncharacterized protein n=1 Tax=Austropuccinia psidii MF-1 TaxID=1389203 RepID=A0A9Q3EXR5_9BASI|nr:hypothetical protein [Austropuccinia psidii MF-1]